MTQEYADIQPRDTTDTETAVENTIQKRAYQHAHEVEREKQAYVRKLMRSAEAAFAGETETDPEDVLDELQEYLDGEPNLREVLSPTFDELESGAKVSFKRFSRLRDRWRAGEEVEIPLVAEYRCYIKVAIALGLIHSASDLTRFAPVTLEKLDIAGARSPVEGEPTPVGRVRVGAGSTTELEDRATEIPHKDCEHILVVANPRQGKDSLICRLAGNLKDEHGYKWVSLHDDGRFETSMIAIPNDEDGIRQSLERFNQEPKGYPTKVYTPAVGLPDELPENHVPFTIGVESLTPEMVAQLSGVSPEGSTERRIKHALEDVQNGSGSVDELIRRLDELADETTAEVSVTELRDDDELEDENVSSKTRTYELGEDKVLQECSQSLMMLASEGLLRDRNAETNLDMVEVLEDQETVAVLNCNFLPDGDDHLKYLLENVWLRLIYQARDKHPWLPRVALEMREIKQLAPSTLTRTKYTKIVKALRQTIFFLSSQGGSRRVLMLGSVQYVNDLYKPVRGNMPLKILLKMGEEKIRTLEGAGFSFGPDERQQLRSFKKGWGMLLMPDGKTFPINWSGARCGLSLGDLEWKHRYGVSMGYRIQQRSVSSLEAWEFDSETYLDKDGELLEAPPSRGEWYLLPEDAREVLDEFDASEALSEDDLEAVLAERRDRPVPHDLRPRPVNVSAEQRSLDLYSSEIADERRESKVFERHEIPGELKSWTRRKEETIRKFGRVLEALEQNSLSTYEEIEAMTGINENTLKQYKNDDERLGACMEKVGGEYRVTPVGKKALDVEWADVFDELD